jgi:prephenate dehydrogenase
MQLQTVGIVGYGNFGSFVHELLCRFAPEIQVRISSQRHAPDGKTFFTLEDVAACDVLVLAVPIHAFEEVLIQVLPHVGPNTVIVDVATVKTHPVEILKRLAADKKYIAIHPMFGPESYIKRNRDVTGFRIVLTDHTLREEELAAAKTWLTLLGFTLLEMSAESHDRNLAETLFLTHFIGQIITHAGFVRTDIDTVSFGYLMDAVESVKNDTALFKDVYRYVPYCKEVLERFRVAEADTEKLLG